MRSLSGAVSRTGVGRPECVFRTTGLFALSLSGSLSGVCASFLSPPTLLKSKAVPGVLGVLLPEAPKDAKAPLPSPNAEEPAAVVGEDTDDVDIWPMGLNELFLLWLGVLLPNRLAEGVSELDWSVLDVDRLSLLLLRGASAVSDQVFGCG